MDRLATLVLGSCATRVMTSLVSLVLSSCHFSRQQELLQVTSEDQLEQWDIRRDRCECMKDPGQGFALSIREWCEQSRDLMGI